MAYDGQSREFGMYFTSNEWLQQYLADKGIKPLDSSQSETGRRTNKYLSDSELRAAVT